MTCCSNGSIYNMGSTIHSKYGSLEVNILSTPEFGRIKNVVIKKGIIGDKREKDYFTIINPKKYELENKFDVCNDSNCYYRGVVELKTNNGDKRLALTNPIWFKPIC